MRLDSQYLFRHASVFVYFIMLLCFCLVLQVLGSPTSLLNQTERADTLESSILEGFSVPSETLISAVPLKSVAETKDRFVWVDRVLPLEFFQPPD